MDKIIRRYNVFKKLLNKGYISEIDNLSFEKSIHELNKEKLEEDKKRLEDKLIENVKKLINF